VIDKSLVERAVPGIPRIEKFVLVAIGDVGAQRPAPCVRRLTGEALRQSLGQLHLQGMVCRVAQISVQRYGIELWIQHKKILRKQATVSDETAALAGNVRAAIQEIRKLAHITVGNKGARVR